MNRISIGNINNQRAAQAFCDYLKSQKINAWAEQEQAVYNILIDNEQSEDFASAELREFLSNPGNSKYLDASWNEGSTETKISSSTNKASFVDLKKFSSRAGFMTKALVIISVVVTAITGYGSNTELTELLFISVPSLQSSGLIEIASGEYWRLLTPIFLHFMTIHILFNMMWLWDLGGSIERIQSPKFLLFFVVTVGILSNLFQYYSSGYSAFGGMSGVVYGLLGYTWMRSLKADSGYSLPKSIIAFMLGWLVLGYTGLIGPIANGAHLAGMVLGVVYGFIWNNMKEKSWQHISVSELHERGEKWQVVDIRDQNTFNEGHIPQAINLNNTNFQSYIDDHDFEKSLVVVCYHGNSSKGAAATMCNAGFKDVYSLDGGMVAWSMQHPELVERS
ncbi:MAG: GlpG protein [Enterobacterales bacterium]|jgi:GlpG protein